MPLPTLIKIRQNPVKTQRMRQLGEKSGLPIRNATIANAFIDFILNIEAKEEIRNAVEKHGGDVLSFVEQAALEKANKI